MIVDSKEFFLVSEQAIEVSWFVLSHQVLFSSENTFKTTDVKHRLETIVPLFKTEGIIVLTYSADGDSRVKIY